MKVYNENYEAILKMEDQKANLLMEVEFLMESMKSGDLSVEVGYENLVSLVGKHLKVDAV